MTPNTINSQILRAFKVPDLSTIHAVEIHLHPHQWPEVIVTRMVIDRDGPESLDSITERFELAPIVETGG